MAHAVWFSHELDFAASAMLEMRALMEV